MDLDANTGVLVPATLSVPDAVPEGNYTVLTSCQGTQPLSVRAPPLPSVSTSPDATTPGSSPSGSAPGSGAAGTDSPGTNSPGTSTDVAETVEVPNLIDLTEADAVAVLGDGLRLAVVAGGAGRIVRQVPLPGAFVTRGSAIDVEFAVPGPGDSSTFPPLLVPAALAALLATAALAWWRARRVRDRRWLRRMRRSLRRMDWEVPAVPDARVPGLDVGFEAHRSPEKLQLQEARDARE